MFSDESMFRLVRGTSKTIFRSLGSDRYDPKLTVKTVNDPSQVMVWGAFSRKGGCGGLYFLPPNVTMRGSNYVNALKDHMLKFFDMHRCSFFLCMMGHLLTKLSLLGSSWQAIISPVLDWPGNSPDLNPLGFHPYSARETPQLPGLSASGIFRAKTFFVVP